MKQLVVLGTGGTIAGTAASVHDSVGYTAAQRSVADLVASAPGLADAPIAVEQVLQLDSKDMGPEAWVQLLPRVAHHLAREEVSAVLITHGTDTLEETAFLLHRVLAPSKPVVLTAAMRPATALGADGPQNLLDAATVARWPGAQGVLVVMAGQVHAGAEVRKWHPYRIDALGSGDAGPLGVVEAGRLRQFRPWPGASAWAAGQPSAVAAAGAGLAEKTGAVPPWQALVQRGADWPWVAIVHSHAGADGRTVAALREAGVQGLVVAGTGNGSVHHALQAALDEAQAAGLPVWTCSRCGQGSLVPAPSAAAGPADGWTPWQARLALQLALVAAQA